MKSGDWTETRYDELRGQADALAERIRVLSGILEATPEPAQRQIIQEQLAALNRQWEEAVARRDRIREDIPQPNTPAPATDSQPLEVRVKRLEHDVHWLKQALYPGPRKALSRVLFYGLLIVAWSLWMVGETRAWLLTHPAQAIIITVLLGVSALIIRWLPEEAGHD